MGRVTGRRQQVVERVRDGKGSVINVYPDAEALAHAAAQLFVRESLRGVAARGRFAFLLSGGETPRRTCQVLATPPFRDRVPWRDLRVFWGDERHVPPEDPRSNFHMARQELLDHVPVPATRINPIPYRCSPHAAAVEYEGVMRAFFAGAPPRFDFVFLGLGTNGHTASLFPGSPVLEERQRWVAEVHLAEEGLDRITVTVPVINLASTVVFLVSGAAKASILREVLDGSPDPHLVPACLIKPVGRLLWLVDRDAARLLHYTR